MLPFLNSLNSPLTSLWKILVAPNSLHLQRVVSGKHVKQEVVGKTLTQEQLSEFKPQILNFLSSPLGYSFRLPHSLCSCSFRGLQLSSLRHLHLACSFQILTPARERSKRERSFLVSLSKMTPQSSALLTPLLCFLLPLTFVRTVSKNAFHLLIFFILYLSPLEPKHQGGWKFVLCIAIFSVPKTLPER